MKNIFRLGFLTLVLSIMAACTKEETKKEELPKPDLTKEFDITEYFIAGTLGSKNKSVYLIKFLEKGKAVFLNSSQEFIGNYTMTKDTLTFEVKNEANYRIAKFALNDKKQVTSAYYRALKMEYPATASLLSVPQENQLAGKVFKGEEYKFGEPFRPVFHYKFDEKGTHYGSGVDANAITPDRNIELINNCAFRFKDTGISEIGYLAGDTLTVFKVQGLYYFGQYKQQ
ncbi:hypothetical protein [Capnocytophaga felis]|uniref:Lipoprotein n=1 Tax=Capnocytophaga felis TaxID=2267611 RepID=A0A5M4B768_9FLAO|nr:hypothetical protein [Capnocytophaga felis]GET45102.1 hypothetical protein RCZ01_04040 [Capnocytophaga felis]GET47734.1 hypothetical protein RCZ02_05650 [Capnocytophaga felis]